MQGPPARTWQSGPGARGSDSAALSALTRPLMVFAEAAGEGLSGIGCYIMKGTLCFRTV